MSDAERHAILERLLRAAGEGRLTLDEFDRRAAGVLAAVTFGEVEPFLADLPGDGGGDAVRPGKGDGSPRRSVSTVDADQCVGRVLSAGRC
jgi:hypothetical protein